MDQSKAAAAVFSKLAQLYQEKFMDVALYHDSFDLFCNSIETENPHILELACGPGNVTKYLLEQRGDFKILGIDLAENMIALAKTNNPKAEFKLMDCRDIKQLSTKYDGIICAFGLPYLSRDETTTLIADASKILNPNGVLYLSTMEENDDNQSGWRKTSTGENEMYMHYHKPKDIVRVLEENGFNIIDLKHQDYPTNDGTKVVDLLIIARIS